ncbi:hypothetical protein BC940DRAFT_333114 [Gongronella butleri]|nr:hypothetical protein BC940DRAFT_333114 [Gongronella butleri]
MRRLKRSEIQEIVKTYGGRMMGAVTSETDYMLLGRGMSEAKKAKVKKLGVKMLEEDAIYDLINSSKGKGKAAVTAAPAAAAPM